MRPQISSPFARLFAGFVLAALASLVYVGSASAQEGSAPQVTIADAVVYCDSGGYQVEVLVNTSDADGLDSILSAVFFGDFDPFIGVVYPLGGVTSDSLVWTPPVFLAPPTGVAVSVLDLSGAETIVDAAVVSPDCSPSPTTLVPTGVPGTPSPDGLSLGAGGFSPGDQVEFVSVDRYDTSPDESAVFGGSQVSSGPVVAAGGAAPESDTSGHSSDGAAEDTVVAADCEAEDESPTVAVFGGGPVLTSSHSANDDVATECEKKAEAEALDKRCTAEAARQKNRFGGTQVVSETGGPSAVDLCKDQAGEEPRVTAGGVVVSAPVTTPEVSSAGAGGSHPTPSSLAVTGSDFRFAYLAMALLGLGFGVIGIGFGARRRSY